MKTFFFQIGKLLSIICFASGASSILKRLYSYGFDILSDFFYQVEKYIRLVIWGILVTSCFTIYTTSDKTTLFNFYIWLETTHYNLSNFHLIICISFSRMLPEKKHLLFFFNLGVSGKYSFLLNYDPLWVEASYIAYYIIGLYCAKVSINCILSLLLNWFLSVFIMTVLCTYCSMYCVQKLRSSPHIIKPWN